MPEAKHRCAGVQRTTYSRGQPCGASPTICRDDVWYCPSHLPEVVEAAARRKEERKAARRKTPG